MAVITAMRSDDAQTKCGCVITDSENTVLSTGFNGIAREFDSELFPNLRPEKYPFMIHAELNALLNCARKGHSTLDSIAYISGRPCNMCLQYMVQSGVNKIYYTDFSKINMNDSKESTEIFNLLKSSTCIGKMLDNFIPFEKLLHSLVNITNLA